MTSKPPVDWWKPQELTRQSYFTGKTGEQVLNLIYNAELQQGYLLIDTPIVAKAPD
jgi:hypothetical protein